MKLKLSDILERAGLHRTTVEYILKRPDTLRGMPEAGRQGQHRKFTLRQAVRLSVCCQLVMLGVQLRDAVNVLKFINRQVRGLKPELDGKGMTFQVKGYNDSWKLEVYNCRFVRVWPDELWGECDARYRYLDLQTGKAERFPTPPRYLTFMSIDLSGMESVLAGKEP